MHKLLEQWLTPAGLLILFGLIVWGVQLNWGLLKVIADNAVQDQIQQEILAKQVEVSANVHETALLVSILMEEMKSMREKVQTHEAEAEMWKERIRHNSQRNGNDE